MMLWLAAPLDYSSFECPRRYNVSLFSRIAFREPLVDRSRSSATSRGKRRLDFPAAA